MILQVSQLVPIVQGFLDDPEGDFATLDYLLPKFQAAQNLMLTTMLENPNIGEIMGLVEVQNVPIGTQSLRDFGAMNLGQPLYTLKSVLALYEKIQGYGAEQYVRATPVFELPPVIPGQLNQLYAWIGQDIKLLGGTSALDIKILGTFEPQSLTSGDSALVPGTAAILQHRVAEMVAIIRGNTALMQYHKMNADNAEDQHFIHLIMAQQSIPIRLLPYPRTTYDLRHI